MTQEEVAVQHTQHSLSSGSAIIQPVKLTSSRIENKWSLSALTARISAADTDRQVAMESCWGQGTKRGGCTDDMMYVSGKTRRGREEVQAGCLSVRLSGSGSGSDSSHLYVVRVLRDLQ